MMTKMRAEKKRILGRTRHLDNLGLRATPMNSPDYECGTHVMYTFPTAEAAEKFVEIMPAVIAGKTGRHTYTEWDQVLMGEGAGHPAMNPYSMPANAACRREVTRDMLPRSLEILARTVMIPTDPRHDDEQIERTVRNIEAAAHFSLGAMSRAEAAAAASEIGDAESIDPRKYDTDVAAYGLDA